MCMPMPHLVGKAAPHTQPPFLVGVWGAKVGIWKRYYDKGSLTLLGPVFGRTDSCADFNFLTHWLLCRLA